MTDTPRFSSTFIFEASELDGEFDRLNDGIAARTRGSTSIRIGS